MRAADSRRLPCVNRRLDHGALKWDSLAKVQLMVMVDVAFGIEFGAKGAPEATAS
jgi:acyl carrier protein